MSTHRLQERPENGTSRGKFFQGSLPPLLSPDEERALTIEYCRTRSPRLAARMIEANLRLVVAMARKQDRSGRLLDDLVQEGSLGLIEAVQRYDPTKGVRLGTYAALWIRAFLTRYKMNNVRLVRGCRTRASRLAFFRGEPAPAEVSLEAIPSGEFGRPLSDRLADNTPAADVLLEQAEGASKAKRCTATLAVNLKPREAVILEKRLLAETPEPLQQVGRQLALSGERVRQIEQNLISLLRTQFAAIDRPAAA